MHECFKKYTGPTEHRFGIEFELPLLADKGILLIMNVV